MTTPFSSKLLNDSFLNFFSLIQIRSSGLLFWKVKWSTVLEGQVVYCLISFSPFHQFQGLNWCLVNHFCRFKTIYFCGRFTKFIVLYIPFQNRSKLRFEMVGNNYSWNLSRLKNNEEEKKVNSQLNQKMLHVYGQCLRPYKNICRNI